MVYAGNDIVAYKHQRCLSKWKDERFLLKILQTHEIENLYKQTNKDAYLWMLWTLKEAAYKLSCFLGNRKKFHPKTFCISDIDVIDDATVQHIEFDKNNIALQCIGNIESTIMFEEQVFNGATLIAHEFVHSVVCNKKGLENLCYAIGKHNNFNKNDYSNEVRTFAIQELLKNKITIDTIYKDEDGIPFIVVNGTEKYISLSHDQQFVSYAY
jgi:phosphopantetheinyl transferase (holo-ACP synthase)